MTPAQRRRIFVLASLTVVVLGAAMVVTGVWLAVGFDWALVVGGLLAMLYGTLARWPS